MRIYKTIKNCFHFDNNNNVYKLTVADEFGYE